MGGLNVGRVGSRPFLPCIQVLWDDESLMSEKKASVGNRSGDGSSLSTHGILLLVCHSSYGPTINGRLLTNCTNYTRRVEITSGKGRA